MSDEIKKYRTWIEINKSALQHNIAQYKRVIGDKLLAPVIKGNAYGHGLKEIAHICQEDPNVGWLCVANVNAAITLRKYNITKPILVLLYIGHNPESAILNNISLTVYDATVIKKLNGIGKKLHKKCKIHIKIDTGLSRLGVFPNNAFELIQYAKSLDYIEVEGIWTHFSESNFSERSFTHMQIKIFNNLIEKLKNEGIKIPFIHSSNSAAITTVESKYENLFRTGAGIYGFWPSDYIKEKTTKTFPGFSLKPILSWKTHILDIKNIPAGNFIGYMRTYQAKKDTKIAILPIGFWEGYDKRLSSKAHVMIHNQYAKIIGPVTMNIILVDITGLHNIKIGDIATLIGNTDKISTENLGLLGDINPREITTKINPEIPRIIVD